MALFNDGVVPIKIREDVTVGIAHLPHDLTEAEADKIIRVIMAHAATVSDSTGGQS